MIDKKYLILIFKISLLLLIFIFIAITGLFQPPFSDDYITLLEAKKFGVINGTIDMYKNWGGNISTYFITYLVERNFFAFTLTGIFTPVLFFSMAYLICLISIGKRPKIFEKDFILFVLCLFILWLLPSGLSEVLFWRSGIHYIIGSIFVLLFIWPFTFYYRDKEVHKWLKFLLPFIGLITGLFTIQFSSTALMYSFFICLLLYLSKKRIPLYLILGIGTLLLGIIIYLISPGNYIRYGTTHHKIGDFVQMITDFLKSGFSYSSIYIFILFLIILLINRLSIKNSLFSITNIIIAPLSIGVFILVPSSQIRYFWLFYVFVILYFFSILNYESYLNSIKSNWLKIITVSIVLILLFNLYNDAKNSIWVYKQHLNREELITNARKNGYHKVEIPPIINRNIRITLANNVYDFENPQSWVRKSYQIYYQIDSIYCQPEYRFKSPGMINVFNYFKQRIKE